MIAGQFTSRRRIELIDVEEPQLPAETPGMMIFQPEVTCLCGSDLPFFDGDFEGHDVHYPQPVGKSLHEMVGTVVETNGSRWQPGTRVLAVPEEQMGLWERYVLSEDRAIALDDRLSDEIALLAQPFGTVVWALKKLPNMIDRNAVVLGLGPIGQMFVAGLRNMGARRIIGVDPVPERTALALQMGATDVVNSTGGVAEDQVRRILNGELADVVVEAVGHRAQAFNDAVLLTAHHGDILYFGVPPSPLDGIHFKEAMLKNITIRTSLHPDFERTFPLAMQWLAEGRVDLSPLLTHRFPLAQMQDAFDIFRDRREGAIKVLVEFPALAGTR
ncbi:MAG TPA: alcohol dehydrogenase [Planctomycetes bacterium]|nr:alcohol dehydrogenase [Fuerstiella sp.]HIK93010.1 alcohol dehydrogenase [Planctomycetota bacterium]